MAKRAKKGLAFSAGVNGPVTLTESCDASGAFLRGGIYRFKKDLKSEFFILFNHLRQTGFINGESFFPTLFFKFFFPIHLTNPIHPYRSNAG